MKNDESIKISVRNLIEFVLRAGDIDSRFRSMNRALAGTKAHQKVQKSKGDNYKPEVFLSYEVEHDGLIYMVEGRADGIILDKDTVTIDEIKSTTLPLDIIDENFNPLHWAQAMCYGYFYAQQNHLNEINIQLTYFHIDSEEIKNFMKTFSLYELQIFFNDLLDKYNIWAHFTKEWILKRNQSIEKLDFPFPAYRMGQRDFAVAVYKTITSNKKLFVQAPTGTGKTISTLFPAVKAMSKGYAAKIFYLTAKTVTRQVAEESIALMCDKGVELKYITLTAKEKICFTEEKICSPEHCPYAKGHFDRVNDAILDVLRNENQLTRSVIETYSKAHQVCPFEFALDLSIWSDIVVCDYNYAFDPQVYLKRFFDETDKDYIFLIDEAHNLVDRGREMFSAQLFKSPFLHLKGVMKDKNIKISNALGKINTFMIEQRKKCIDESYHIEKKEPIDFYPLLRKFISESEDWLAKNEKTEGHGELLQLYFDVMAFLHIAELYDESFITYVESNYKDTTIKLYCVDPSTLLSKAFMRSKAAVLFSATLMPIKYFREILGGKEEDYLLQLPSPFHKENLGLYIIKDISTKYKNREVSYSPIADYIYAAANAQNGNYLVFFPSYEYMNRTYDIFSQKFPHIPIALQLPNMPEEERESFLAQFRPNVDKQFIAFAVMGGIFSEGIDLKGSRLTGSIIVGVGLPQLCLERNIIKDYFTNKNGKGYEYAYVFPGMNKVLQAAGRVIRTETDTGSVVLIDERFAYSSYKQLFPKEWSHYKEIGNLETFKETIEDFWIK